MKSKLMLLAVLALLMAAIIAPAAAQDMDSDMTTEAAPAALTASSDLFVIPFFRVNLRSGPGTEYTVLAVVTTADALDITGQTEDGSWLRLNYMGQSGWVLADLMDITGDVATAPVAEAGANAVLRSSVPAPVVEETMTTDEAEPLEIMTFFNTNLRAPKAPSTSPNTRHGSSSATGPT
jgi:uncharacterized protein YraI